MKDGVRIWRDDNGVPHVDADNVVDMYWGQGYTHATDRGLQMLLMRILGQGRVSELLDGSDEALSTDKFFRRMNWCGAADGEIDEFSATDQICISSYCDGVNAAFSRKAPWELRLLGYGPETWEPEHSLIIARMIGYLTLAQSQAESERLLVELVQAGTSREMLEELFPGILGGLDIELIRKVTLHERIVPSHVLWNTAAPRLMASNNWVVSGSKTASGQPIVANDPHLEGNRLPNVWSEIVLRSGERYVVGGSMPGLPGMMTGRTRNVAWGVTYSFADSVDSWIERCREGKCYREKRDAWVSPRHRKEVIRRKKKDSVEISFWENEHGVIDGDPRDEGYYLATRWAGAESSVGSVHAILSIWDVESAEEAMDTFGKVDTGWNFVLADTRGNIAYQMSGRIPRRRAEVSGFVPLPGWRSENDWQGFLSHEELPRIQNPPDGYFVTANNDLNEFGTASPINMPMGSYRADRISDLLEREARLTVGDMGEMHFDVYSLQAERFMAVLRPLLPETLQGEILKDWDLNYDAESKGAFLFERWYRELYRVVFSRGEIGEGVVDFLEDETGVFVDFYENFDRILLSESSLWFGEQTREQVFQTAADRSLQSKPRRWGEVQRFQMKHILFGDKLPTWAGFNRGPVVAIGGRATVHQGQIYRSGGRETTFVPSYRTISDLAEDALFSNLAGGPSDRRFSKWYCSDLKNWLSGRYKKLVPNDDETKRPL